MIDFDYYFPEIDRFLKRQKKGLKRLNKKSKLYKGTKTALSEIYDNCVLLYEYVNKCDRLEQTIARKNKEIERYKLLLKSYGIDPQITKYLNDKDKRFL